MKKNCKSRNNIDQYWKTKLNIKQTHPANKRFLVKTRSGFIIIYLTSNQFFFGQKILQNDYSHRYWLPFLFLFLVLELLHSFRNELLARK